MGEFYELFNEQLENHDPESFLEIFSTTCSSVFKNCSMSGLLNQYDPFYEPFIHKILVSKPPEELMRQFELLNNMEIVINFMQIYHNNSTQLVLLEAWKNRIFFILNNFSDILLLRGLNCHGFSSDQRRINSA